MPSQGNKTQTRKCYYSFNVILKVPKKKHEKTHDIINFHN